MKDIFLKLATKGYEVYNKRVLGNPAYTSEETKLKDITQEIALVVEWLRVNHGIFIQIFPAGDNGKMVFYCKIIKNDKGWVKIIHQISKWVDSPQEAYSAAFDYVLNNLI